LFLLAKAFPLVQCPTIHHIRKVLAGKIAPTFVLRTVPFVFGKIFTRDGSRKVCNYTQCNEKSQLQAKWEMGPSFRPGACCKQTFATFIFVIMTLEWAISGKVERLLNIWPGNGNA